MASVGLDTEQVPSLTSTIWAFLHFWTGNGCIDSLTNLLKVPQILSGNVRNPCSLPVCLGVALLALGISIAPLCNTAPCLVALCYSQHMSLFLGTIVHSVL